MQRLGFRVFFFGDFRDFGNFWVLGDFGGFLGFFGFRVQGLKFRV